MQTKQGVALYPRKAKSRGKSSNIENRTKNKIKAPYEGPSLSNRFTPQSEYLLPRAGKKGKTSFRRRGRKVSVSSKNRIYGM